MLSLRTTHSSQHDTKKLKHAFFIVLSFTALLWSIKLIEVLWSLNLPMLGVRPGQLSGLMGVLPAPLIHGSFEHLIANTPAILILGTALIYGYPRSWWVVVPVVWFGSGLGVWFTGRSVFHFGASGLTYGLMFFIFIVGILRRDRLAIALALLVFFLYGTMIWGVFPHQTGISFETHLWGAAMGVLCALLLRRRDPTPPVKHYEWEGEEEASEDPLISEAWNPSSETENNTSKEKIES